ncbi:hypothetical protein MTP99_019113 [Tenebrio molitor]|nr:hypothetical protein MTP99_019113 [Tenebrio molitor]
MDRETYNQNHLSTCDRSSSVIHASTTPRQPSAVAAPSPRRGETKTSTNSLSCHASTFIFQLTNSSLVEMGVEGVRVTCPVIKYQSTYICVLLLGNKLETTHASKLIGVNKLLIPLTFTATRPLLKDYLTSCPIEDRPKITVES